MKKEIVDDTDTQEEDVKTIIKQRNKKIDDIIYEIRNKIKMFLKEETDTDTDISLDKNK